MDGFKAVMNKWQSKGAFETEAGKDAIRKLNKFINKEGQLFEHVWKDINETEEVQIRVEIIFLLDSFEDKRIYNTNDLMATLDRITNRALEKR